MYFKSYNPTTLTDNAARARATHIYNAVKRFSGKEKPTIKDYREYQVYKKLPSGARYMAIAAAFEHLGYHEKAAEARTSAYEMADTLVDMPTWAEIIKTVRQCGTSPNGKPVVYFAIIESGVKCGETSNIVVRHCQINATTPIQHMWYMELESKEQAKKAEHVLHGIFDHARHMYRKENKLDYYSCSAEQAQKFITANVKKMYQAIMEELGMEKEE